MLAIREFLGKAVVNWKGRFELTPETIALWVSKFQDCDAAPLRAAFERCLDESEHPPTIASIKNILKQASGHAEAIASETAWQAAMNWLARWFHPDLGVCRGAPKLDEKIRRAMDAAGGFAWLYTCPSDELQWAKKRFVENFQHQAELEASGLLIENSPAAGLLDSMRDELAKTEAPPPKRFGALEGEGGKPATGPGPVLLPPARGKGA